MLNHHKEPNVRIRFESQNGYRPWMNAGMEMFVLPERPLGPGVELYLNYGDDWFTKYGKEEMDLTKVNSPIKALPSCDASLSIHISESHSEKRLEFTGYYLRSTRSFRVGEIVAVSPAIRISRSIIKNEPISLFSLNVNAKEAILPLGRIGMVAKTLSKELRGVENCRWHVLHNNERGELAVAAIATRDFDAGTIIFLSKNVPPLSSPLPKP